MQVPLWIFLAVGREPCANSRDLQRAFDTPRHVCQLCRPIRFTAAPRAPPCHCQRRLVGGLARRCYALKFQAGVRKASVETRVRGSSKLAQFIRLARCRGCGASTVSCQCRTAASPGTCPPVSFFSLSCKQLLGLHPCLRPGPPSFHRTQHKSHSRLRYSRLCYSRLRLRLLIYPGGNCKSLAAGTPARLSFWAWTARARYAALALKVCGRIPTAVLFFGARPRDAAGAL